MSFLILYFIEHQSSSSQYKNRGRSNNDARSEYELSKYEKSKPRLDSSKKPVKMLKDIPITSAIQQTIDQSRYNQKKLLLAMYELNGAYDSMKKLIMSPISKT